VENVTTKKKIVTGILLVVIVGLILGSVYLMQRMPQFREATQEEIAKYAIYKVDWKKLEGMQGKTEIDIILSMCTEIDPSTIAPAAEQTTEATTDPAEAKYYTSETLGQHLHLYKSDLAVTFVDGVLSVGYTDQNGLVVVLGYDSKGFYALGVHDAQQDMAYFEQNGKASVATNVSGSFSG
jgi:hypothetical protein